MSQLRTFNTGELFPIDQNQVAPGSFVRHADDHDSFGIVVSQVGEESSVLWSKQPLIIRIQKTDLYVPPVPRKSHVNFVEKPDYMSPGFAEIAHYELQESYGTGDLSGEDVEQMTARGDKVTLYQDVE